MERRKSVEERLDNLDRRIITEMRMTYFLGAGLALIIFWGTLFIAGLSAGLSVSKTGWYTLILAVIGFPLILGSRWLARKSYAWEKKREEIAEKNINKHKG